MGKKILFADDEPDILKIVTIRLSKMGYDVVMTTDGQQAIDLSRQQKPDLILLDYRMPVLDGIEACRKIKDDAGLKNIPVIIMSASTANLNAGLLKDVRADDFISKPFEAADLVVKIKRLIGE